jgi:hypothetical protein
MKSGDGGKLFFQFFSDFFEQQTRTFTEPIFVLNDESRLIKLNRECPSACHPERSEGPDKKMLAFEERCA